MYRQLADRIDQVEELNIQARRSLTTMSLLGVVAAFMTHENKSLVFEMERAIKQISSLAKKHPGLREISAGLNAHLSTFKGQLQYVQMFLAAVRKTDAAKMSASGQIRHVLNRFESFATEHGVEVTTDAPPQTQTPPLSPAMYSGVLLNLYSNALKAVLSVFSSIRHPKIAIRSWNERGSHYLEVSDNGAGIPIELRKRIWEPPTRQHRIPGTRWDQAWDSDLTVVKQVVEDAGGKDHTGRRCASGL